MIQNLPEILLLCVPVIGGLIGAGWKLSDKVDSISQNYQEKVARFEDRKKAEAAKEIETLYNQLSMSKRDESSKMSNIATMLQKVLELASQRRPAGDYFKEMWTSCSIGGRSLLYAGIVAFAYPILSYLYSDQFNQIFIIAFLVTTVVVTVLAANGLFEVRDFIKNRDSLMRLLGT